MIEILGSMIYVVAGYVLIVCIVIWGAVKWRMRGVKEHMQSRAEIRRLKRKFNAMTQGAGPAQGDEGIRETKPSTTVAKKNSGGAECRQRKTHGAMTVGLK